MFYSKLERLQIMCRNECLWFSLVFEDCSRGWHVEIHSHVPNENFVTGTATIDEVLDLGIDFVKSIRNSIG